MIFVAVYGFFLLFLVVLILTVFLTIIYFSKNNVLVKLIICGFLLIFTINFFYIWFPIKENTELKIGSYLLTADYNATVPEVSFSLGNKGYLKKEYPKRKIAGKRVQDTNLPIGYNIVTGKMSFEINKILNPESIAPTLVAMDMRGLFVVDGKGLRNLSLREGLRLFGYPEDFKFEIEKSLGYDLLGNTVVVPAIEEVSKRVLKIYY